MADIKIKKVSAKITSGDIAKADKDYMATLDKIDKGWRDLTRK